jgi:WXG100 family type VII secretion target
MSTLLVTSENLLGLSAEALATSDEVSALLDRLRARVKPVSGTWQGQASDAFQALFDDWDRGANQVRDALSGIASLLHAAGTTYQQAEDGIRSAMTF